MNIRVMLIFFMLTTPLYADVFSIISVGDNHEYGDQTNLNSYVNFAINNKDKLNIKYFFHLGDSVKGVDGNIESISGAKKALDKLNGKIPYLFAIGNHEYDSINNYTSERNI